MGAKRSSARSTRGKSDALKKKNVKVSGGPWGEKGIKVLLDKREGGYRER